MSTYWTKCGREFRKSTKAATTGYAIDPDDKQCADCPFQVDVTEGYPPVHKRWECRAGSQPPNHTTDWIGHLDDKNTIGIRSLDNVFLESVREHCRYQADLTADYQVTDLPDCRRTLTVTCSKNKAGMAAKAALIEHFFPAVEVPANTSRPEPEPAIGDKSWQPKCPYLESIGQQTISCSSVHCHPIADKGFSSDGEFREHIDIYCFGNFDWCETYQQAYKSEMESEDPDIKQYQVCDYCCNNSGYTGLSDSSKGAEYGYCQVWHEDRKKHDPNTVCKYFNQKYREDGQMISDTEKCKFGNQDCGYYCKHNRGCSLLLSTGDALKNTVDEFGPVDCDVYRDQAPAEDTEPTEDKALDVVPAGELKPFDYSTVDNEMADFLQEKASRITEIRIRSVVAIGKELTEAHEKLANNKIGTFEAWVVSLGISHKTSRNYINAYEYILKNFQHIEDADNMQPSLLFAISKPSANPALAEAAVSGDITTLKEYRELEARLKAEQAEKADAKAKMQQAQAEKNEALRAYENDISYLHQQLEDAKKKANPGKVQRLEKQISDLQQEIADLQNRPVEVAVKEVIPEDTKKELNRLKLKQPKYQDYENVGRILDELSLFTIEKIWNWANVVAEDADRETIAELRIRAEKALKAVQEIHRAITPPDPPPLVYPEPDIGMGKACCDCRFSDIDAVTEEQLDQDLTYCNVYKKPVKLDSSCDGYMSKPNK